MQFREQMLKKALTFSFDDGITQDIRMIELLNKYGLKSTFNLNSELLGGHRILIREGLRIAHYKIAPEDVRYVYEGHEIASHTLTHPNLSESLPPAYLAKAMAPRPMEWTHPAARALKPVS